MKELPTRRNWLIMISFSCILLACQKTKYRWEPAISAPKYYPVGGVKVDFGSAGNSSLTNFDNGWGSQYGSISSGSEYKEVPTEVNIEYYSAVDNLKYKGAVKLEKEKLKDLFQKYVKGKKNSAHLLAGMAPGGWVRVWFTTIDVQIEVGKAKLKGIEDNTIGDGFKNKKSEYWSKYKIYWQHHGVPYEAWAENENEYDLLFDFNKPNNQEVGFSYVSQDGTFYQGIGIDKRFRQKLPVEMEIAWLGKSKESLCCKIIMPKELRKYVEKKRLKQINFRLEIENNQQYGNLYLISDTIKEKLIRFKNRVPTAVEKKNKDYAYAKEIEYFIK